MLVCRLNTDYLPLSQGRRFVCVRVRVCLCVECVSAHAWGCVFVCMRPCSRFSPIFCPHTSKTCCQVIVLPSVAMAMQQKVALRCSSQTPCTCSNVYFVASDTGGSAANWKRLLHVRLCPLSYTVSPDLIRAQVFYCGLTCWGWTRRCTHADTQPDTKIGVFQRGWQPFVALWGEYCCIRCTQYAPHIPLPISLSQSFSASSSSAPLPLFTSFPLFSLIFPFFFFFPFPHFPHLVDPSLLKTVYLIHVCSSLFYVHPHLSFAATQIPA